MKLSPETVNGLLGISGAILGVIFTKVFDYIVVNHKQASDDLAALRKELWDEIGELRKTVERLESEVTDWKKKYFDQVEEDIEVKRAATDLKQQYTNLQHDYDTLKGESESMSEQLKILNDLVKHSLQCYPSNYKPEPGI